MAKNVIKLLTIYLENIKKLPGYRKIQQIINI